MTSPDRVSSRFLRKTSVVTLDVLVENFVSAYDRLETVAAANKAFRASHPNSPAVSFMEKIRKANIEKLDSSLKIIRALQKSGLGNMKYPLKDGRIVFWDGGKRVEIKS
ncbi:MAG: hypothetical protein WC824_14765 [Bacteroidota bacterium]|jgi:hypothetical protein